MSQSNDFDPALHVERPQRKSKSDKPAGRAEPNTDTDKPAGRAEPNTDTDKPAGRLEQP